MGFKKNDLWVVNMASCDDDKHGESLSGGERIALESLKIWNNKFSSITVICDRVWKDKSKKYLGRESRLKYEYFEVPEKLYQNLFGLYIYKLWKTYWLIQKLKLNEGDYVFSISDIFPDTITAYWLKRKYRKTIRWVAALYFFASNPMSKEFPYRGIVPKIRGWLYWLTQNICYLFIRKKADFVFSCNDIDKEIMVEDGINRDRIFSVYGGVDLKIPDKVEKQKIKYEAIFMARFHPQKGPVEAIEVWKDVVKVKPGAKLGMIGKGSEELKMRELIRKYGLEKNIDLLGFMDGVEKYKVLKSAKVFLHTAIYDTGGMAVAEGMAAGLPAVAFDQSGYKYIYPTGMIRDARVGDLKKVAKELLELLDDKEKYAKLRNEAMELVKNWSWDKRSLAMYREMTK